MVGRGRRLARGADGSGHAGQPDVQQEAGRVRDQGVVLLRLHVGVVLRRLAVLEAGVGGDVDAGNAVILQPDRLRQAGPDVYHVRHDGVPIELGRALPRRGEGQFVVVGHLLAGVAGVLGRELGHERPDRHHVRLAVPQGREVAAEAGLIEALFVGGRWHGNVLVLAGLISLAEWHGPELCEERGFDEPHALRKPRDVRPRSRQLYGPCYFTVLARRPRGRRAAGALPCRAWRRPCRRGPTAC